MDETIRRDAYMKGLKLKNTGLDAEAIYARLEKQGIPEELAKEVAMNVMIQRQEDAVFNQPPPGFWSRTAWLVSGIWKK